MKEANILLLDDEVLFRQGLRSLLQKENFVRDIFEAGDSKVFFSQVLAHNIDIVLLDVKLPGVRGLEVLLELRKKKLPCKVIAVTGLEGVEVVVNLLKNGVNGVVHKLDGYGEIANAIRGVLQDGNYFQQKTLRVIQNSAYSWDNVPTTILSFHENELLRAIARGLTTKQIAGELRMTEATTETYRIRLTKKLGAPNTAALLAYAFRNGML